MEDTTQQPETNVEPLLEDPDIRKILEARREGKQVVVSDKPPQENPEDQPQPENDEEPVPEDEATRKALEIIEKRYGKTLRSIEDALERLKNIESQALEAQKKEVIEAVNAVRKKHPDFDTYRNEMLKISETASGLSVEEIYLIAKHRAGKLPIRESATFLERPTTEQNGRPGRKPPGEVKPGRKGFSSLLRESLSNLRLEE